MSECFEEPHLEERLEEQSRLAKILQSGDYVIWDRRETTEGRVSERIVSFDGSTAIREYSRSHGPMMWHIEPVVKPCICHNRHVQF